MPKEPTPERLIAQAKESLLEGLSVSPIGQPPENIFHPAVTHFDNAMMAAGTALYKTDRRKKPEEKAAAIIIFALVHRRLGCLTWAAREIMQARELAGASFVNDLIMELTDQSAEIILG